MYICINTCVCIWTKKTQQFLLIIHSLGSILWAALKTACEQGTISIEHDDRESSSQYECSSGARAALSS